MTDSVDISASILALGEIEIPPTPRLARQLFLRSEDSVKPPDPSTEEEKLCDGEPFHTTMSRLLFQAMPTLKLDVIDKTVKDFFASNHITTEDGLSSMVPDDDLPGRNESPNGSYWKIVLFRRAMTTIITGCCSFRLLPNTPYSLLLQHSRGVSSGLLPGSQATSVQPKVYSVKTVASVSLKPFSGLTCDFKAWHDSVENAYGICGHQRFLTDELICNQNDAVSYSVKCNLVTALKDGTLAYLSEEMKHERNAFKFLQGIRLAADEKADHRNREFKQWLDLFTQTLTNPEDCYSFINKFSLSVSALKEAKSVGVTDDALMRALLLQSIQCEEFARIKLDITKNLDMKPNEIVQELKSHQLALDSEGAIKEGRADTTLSRTVRRGNASDGKAKFGDTKPACHIPAWPKGLQEVCPKFLWKQLVIWKSLVNKTDKKWGENKRLREFLIHPDFHGNSEKPAYRQDDRSRPNDHGDDRKPSHNDFRSRDRRNHPSPRYDSGEDKRKRDRATRDGRLSTRSPKTNRHSDDRHRNVRRRVHYSDCSSDDGNVSDGSAVSVIQSRRTPRTSFKNDSEDEDRSGNRILMGGVLRK